MDEWIVMAIKYILAMPHMAYEAVIWMWQNWKTSFLKLPSQWCPNSKVWNAVGHILNFLLFGTTYFTSINCGHMKSIRIYILNAYLFKSPVSYAATGATAGHFCWWKAKSFHYMFGAWQIALWSLIACLLNTGLSSTGTSPVFYHTSYMHL